MINSLIWSILVITLGYLLLIIEIIEVILAPHSSVFTLGCIAWGLIIGAVWATEFVVLGIAEVCVVTVGAILATMGATLATIGAT